MSLNNVIIDEILLKAIKKFEEKTGEYAFNIQINDKFFDYIIINHISVDFKAPKEQQKFSADEQHLIISKLADEGKI